MEEQLVSFKTAKLAKEVGFNEPTDWCYIGSVLHSTIGSPEYLIQQKAVNNYTPAPTQSLLQKWLREEHNTDIIILPNILGYETVIYNKYPLKKLQLKSIFKTYEEALETILYRALELIKL